LIKLVCITNENCPKENGECINCSDMGMHLNDKGECEKCPNGQGILPSTRTCVQCIGQYSFNHKPIGGYCGECPENTYYIPEKQKCIPCPEGSTYDVNLGVCICNSKEEWFDNEKERCVSCTEKGGIIVDNVCKCKEENQYYSVQNQKCMSCSGDYTISGSECICDTYSLLFEGQCFSCSNSMFGGIKSEETHKCECDYENGYGWLGWQCVKCTDHHEDLIDGMCQCTNGKTLHVINEDGEQDCVPCSEVSSVWSDEYNECRCNTEDTKAAGINGKRAKCSCL